MSKVEIKNKIEKLEESIFYLDMIDKWDDEIRIRYNELSKQIKELKTLLA